MYNVIIGKLKITFFNKKELVDYLVGKLDEFSIIGGNTVEITLSGLIYTPDGKSAQISPDNDPEIKEL